MCDDEGSLFAGHSSDACSWSGDDGRDSTKGGLADDVDDGERGGLSEYSGVDSDGESGGFRCDMMSTLMRVVVVR